MLRIRWISPGPRPGSLPGAAGCPPSHSPARIPDGQVVEEHLRVNGDASVLECVAERANSLTVGMASFEVNVQDLLVVPRTPLVQHHFDTIDDEHGEQTACRRVKELLHLRSQRMREQRRPPLK